MSPTPKDRQVSDPHPHNEQHYDRMPHPGGAHPPHDIGPNDAIHTGKAPPKPPYGNKIEGQRPVGTRS
jgi:hypothetical protein